MKKVMVVKLVAFFVCVLLFADCNPVEDPATVMASEGIEGYVKDEYGNSLRGIRVEAYLDEELNQRYDDMEWVDAEGNVYLDENLYKYTDLEGYYSFRKATTYTKYSEQYKDVYVVVTDTSGFYMPQVQKGRIKYSDACVGECRLDFTLQQSNSDSER